MCIASGLWAMNNTVWFIIRMSCRQEFEPGQLARYYVKWTCLLLSLQLSVSSVILIVRYLKSKVHA